MVMWGERVRDHEGDAFHRSWQQMFRGCGWPAKGTVKADKRFYKTRALNTLTYLRELGWWEQRVPVYRSDRTSTGLDFVLARRDSSVGEAIWRTMGGHEHRHRRSSSSSSRVSERRSSHPSGPSEPPAPASGCSAPARTRSSISRQVAPPSGDHTVSGVSPLLFLSSGSSREQEQCARADARTREARPPSEARQAWLQRDALAAEAAVAVSQWAAETDRAMRTGVALLEALPLVAEVPAVAFARLAWDVHAADREAGLDSVERREFERGWPDSPGMPVISALWQRRLDVEVRRLERYGYGTLPEGTKGAGHAMLWDAAAGGWREYRGSAPYSLGGLAVCARRAARGERFCARLLEGRGERMWRLRDMHARQDRIAAARAARPVDTERQERDARHLAAVDRLLAERGLS